MRHLTEYEGFRPSILAQTVVLGFPATWFNLTSGVFPILRELSSNVILAFSFSFPRYIYPY